MPLLKPHQPRRKAIQNWARVAAGLPVRLAVRSNIFTGALKQVHDQDTISTIVEESPD